MKFISSQLFLLSLLFFVVFKSWFNFSLATAGDFLPNFSSIMRDMTIIPYAWGWNLAIGGMGGFISPYSWLYLVLAAPVVILGKMFGLTYETVIKVSYLYPLLVLLIASPLVFFKTFLPENRFYSISVLIFSLNTYILMIIGGGQIFIALAYSLVPFFLVLAKKIMDSQNLKTPLFAGLLFGLQIMLDLRIAVVTSFIVFLYVLFDLIFIKKRFHLKPLLHFLVAITIAGLLNFFWILPAVLTPNTTLSQFGDIYSSSGAVKFFSFAKLEDTISLLHPNWPENLFGKVYFMRPEFLILPIIAFVSLLFIRGKDKIIIFFVLLGLIGAFLSKGANDPFGNFYIWLFEYVPGFKMFRDPTKWYVLVAVSYSVLIPFTVLKSTVFVASRLKKSKIKSQIPNIFAIITVSYIVFLIRPTIFGDLSGMFKTTQVPDEYKKLEKYLNTQSDFYRTLWIPAYQRYGYYSNKHSAIQVQQYPFKTATLNTLQEDAIKYIIVPFDSEKELFLKDRKYSDELYKVTIAKIGKIQYLKEVRGFGRIKIFEVPFPKDHFFSNGKNFVRDYQYINPTKYIVNINEAKKGDVLVFSERFDSNWTARIGMDSIHLFAQPYKKRLNSFVLPKDGNYTLEVFYKSQKWAHVGFVITLVMFIFCCVSLIVMRPRLIFKK